MFLYLFLYFSWEIFWFVSNVISMVYRSDLDNSGCLQGSIWCCLSILSDVMWVMSSSYYEMDNLAKIRVGGDVWTDTLLILMMKWKCWTEMSGSYFWTLLLENKVLFCGLDDSVVVIIFCNIEWMDGDGSRLYCQLFGGIVVFVRSYLLEWHFL